MSAAATFETAYQNWLQYHDLEEIQEPHDTNSTLFLLVGTDGFDGVWGHALHTPTATFIAIPHEKRDNMNITPVDYLSSLQDYNLSIWGDKLSLNKCWLGHTILESSWTAKCATCAKLSYNLHQVRAAGRTWLLTDILADIKHLIARRLSQFALPETTHL